MRRPARAGAAVALLAAIAALPLRAQEAPAPQPAEQAAPAQGALPEPMPEIGDLVRRHFYEGEAVPRFEAAESALRGAGLSGGALSEAIDQTLASLGASHTGRYTPDEIEYYELFDIFALGREVGNRARGIFRPDGLVNYPGIGMIARPINGKTFVTHVYHGGPADRAGIKLGDEVVAIDGAPYAPVGSFQGKVGRDVQVEIRRGAGEAAASLAVPVWAIQPTSLFRDAIRNSAKVFERNGRRVGYLRIWTFASAGVDHVLTDVLSSEPLKSADALVLDMRSRWGGAPPDAVDMFIGRSPTMTVTDREGEERIANFSWRQPVVGIIDEGTRSGMEILAHALKQAGVPLIGTRTAGAVLAGRAFVLADDSLLLIAVLDVEVDGTQLEGNGVTPDIEVPVDIRYANGADPQLDRALEEADRVLAD